jgi:hypothetical protein
VKKPHIARIVTSIQPATEQSQVEHAMRLAIAASDAKAVRDLRERLSLLGPGGLSPAAKWTRRDAIQILHAMADFIKFITADHRPDKKDEDKTIFEIVEDFRDHRTARALRELATALADLDEGKIDERLKKTEKMRGRALTALARQNINRWLAAVEITLARDKTLTRAAARKEVAVQLKDLGIKFLGKPITAKNLDSWKREPPGKRK